MEYITKKKFTKNWLWLVWILCIAIFISHLYSIITATGYLMKTADLGDVFTLIYGTVLYFLFLFISLICIFYLPSKWFKNYKIIKIEKICTNCKHFRKYDKLHTNGYKKVRDENYCDYWNGDGQEATSEDDLLKLKNLKPCEKFKLK